MRDRHRGGTSPTYDICRLLAKRAGKGVWGDENAETKEWNEADAEFIEGVWRMCTAYLMPPPQIAMLRAYYVLGQPPHLICRFYTVRAREFDDILVRAVGNFQQAVEKMEKTAQNAVHP